MADTPIDLHVPDTFHRLKRTVLLLSAALLLLCLVAPTGSQPLHLSIVDITVPSAVLKWLLWTGALYYVVGFVMEVMTVRRLNTEPMRQGGPKTIHRTIEAVAATIDNHNEQLVAVTQDFSKIKDATGQLVDLFGKPETVIEALSQQLLPHVAGAPETRQSVSTVIAQHQLFMELLQHKVDEVARNITESKQEILAASSRLQGDLLYSRRALTRISDAVVGTRFASFWFWDIGGALGAFVLASALLVFTTAAPKAMPNWLAQKPAPPAAPAVSVGQINNAPPQPAVAEAPPANP